MVGSNSCFVGDSLLVIFNTVLSSTSDKYPVDVDFSSTLVFKEVPKLGMGHIPAIIETSNLKGVFS